MLKIVFVKDNYRIIHLNVLSNHDSDSAADW